MFDRFPALRCLIAGLLLACTPRAGAGDVVLNFRDTDIRAVIESVAEITGRSFVLDPRVQGKISVVAPEPVREEDLLEVLQSALQAQGYQAVDDGLMIRVMPFSAAFRAATDGGGSMRTEVLRLHHARATEVATLVKNMMSTGAMVRGFDDGNYLVVTDTAAQVTRLRAVLRDLDSAADNEIEVVQLHHLEAAEAIHLAGQMKHLQDKGLSLVEDQLNNRIVLGGNRMLRQDLRHFLQSIDRPADSAGSITVVPLSYSDATALKGILEEIVNAERGQGGAGEAGDGGRTGTRHSIQADVATNSLLISAPPALTAQLRKAVERIDRPRQQVLIEAVLAEISQDQATRLSGQIAVLSRDTGGALVRFDNLIPALIGAAIDRENDELDGEEAAAILGQRPGGLTGVVGDTWDDGRSGVAVLIEALRSDANTNILSTPSVVTLNNDEAVITVGQEVPFITGSYTSTNNDVGNPFQTIEREEVGVKLKVIPRITEDGAVQLRIEQEASNLLATAAQAGTADVITAKRAITTNVSVRDREFLVLGGLIDEVSNRDDSKVPVLGDIPVLGYLFRARDRAGQKRVLMMFIRPTVIGSPAIAESVFRNRYEHLRQHELQSLEAVEDPPPPLLSEQPEDLLQGATEPARVP
jgi:general secretion pathway protein D